MEKEAADIAKKLNLNKSENYKNMLDRVYRKDEISLLITGIGKQQTAISLIQYLENNEKPETFIKLITDNCKKLKLPKHITQSILPKGKEKKQKKEEMLYLSNISSSFYSIEIT